MEQEVEVSIDIDMMIKDLNRDIIYLWERIKGRSNESLQGHYDWLIDYHVDHEVGNYSLPAHTIATAWWHYDHNRYELPHALVHLSHSDIERIWKHIKGIK